ncbi:LA2681 family HEPN domain-containing protein [Leptospira kmetyi]|uniref:LA2681-like HEPN domain-containing protein n=1 Tax=Leptospira kmetyi TaxID=408139 RepID=A0ABX4N6D7_9LEPT|nr:LA2681 family HEPN domain-containing protein [Leptospira kmetyi]PJZ27719.1 hypothetical protein CH378_21605 [Leptospira kmetyi]
MKNIKLKIEELNDRIEKGDLSDAISLTQQILTYYNNAGNTELNSLSYIKFVCYLIDVADFTGDPSLLEEGYNRLKNNYDIIKHTITTSALEYNLGNARKSLFDSQRRDANFQYSIDSFDILKEAISHYHKAFRSLKKMEKNVMFISQLSINFANALNVIGRVTEAIIYYKKALALTPDKFEANANIANSLKWYNQLSEKYSISLLMEILNFTERAIADTPAYFNTDDLKSIRFEIFSVLMSQNIKITPVLNENHSIWEATESFDDSQIFCIKNHLYLSEHGVYCQCEEGRKDDLELVSAKDKNLIPSYIDSLYLQIKQEYVFARKMIYVFTSDKEDEMIRSESLRTGYRLTYGIFDKIAQGILFTYNLEQEENVYFETFWRKKNVKNVLDQVSNFNVFALNSIASDLNRQNGELGFFKEWRNKLEHGLFLTKYNEQKMTPDVIHISEAEFFDKTIMILQIARSAIFSFVFMIRNKYANRYGA